MRAELRLPCVALTPPAPSELPTIAADPAIRGVQLAERSYWMRWDVENQVLLAKACARNTEQLRLIDAYNDGVRALRGRAP